VTQVWLANGYTARVYHDINGIMAHGYWRTRCGRDIQETRPVLGDRTSVIEHGIVINIELLNTKWSPSSNTHVRPCRSCYR
jgi:hypothetical protein